MKGGIKMFFPIVCSAVSAATTSTVAFTKGAYLVFKFYALCKIGKVIN